MNRRQFVGVAAVSAGAAAGILQASGGQTATAPALPEPSASRLPRWRGFNLLEKFDAQHARPFREADFALLADWGFNFVRLPMSYRCWADADDWLNIREKPLKDVDGAVRFGQRHGVHVNLNLHRAPGYCVNPPKEPADLWTDDKALDACAFHWAYFTRRYKGVPNRNV